MTNKKRLEYLHDTAIIKLVDFRHYYLYTKGGFVIGTFINERERLHNKIILPTSFAKMYPPTLNELVKVDNKQIIMTNGENFNRAMTFLLEINETENTIMLSIEDFPEEKIVHVTDEMISNRIHSFNNAYILTY